MVEIHDEVGASLGYAMRKAVEGSWWGFRGLIMCERHLRRE